MKIKILFFTFILFTPTCYSAAKAYAKARPEQRALIQIHQQQANPQAAVEVKQVAEVVQLLNTHLSNQKLRNNQSLQNLIKDVGIQISDRLKGRDFDEEYLNKVRQDVYHNTVKILDPKNRENVYPNLPEILSNPKKLRKFIYTLVDRYSKAIDKSRKLVSLIPKKIKEKYLKKFLINSKEFAESFKYVRANYGFAYLIYLVECKSLNVDSWQKIVDNLFEHLNFKQIRLLNDLAKAKAEKGLIILRKDDKQIFDSLPLILRIALIQNLKFKHKMNSLVVKLLNYHLKDETLKNNVALQELIHNIGNQIAQRLANQKITTELIVKIINDINGDVIVNIAQYDGLPKILYKNHHLKEFILTLVLRYIKKFRFLSNLYNDLEYITGAVANQHLKPFIINEKLLRNITTYSINKQKKINCIAFSANRYLAMASNDKNVVIIDLHSGESIVIKHKSKVYWIGLSFDKQLLATASKDGSAKIIRIKTGEEIRTIIHQGGITHATFSPCGNYLATASLDKTARVTDLKTGRKILEVKHDAKVFNVKFSPDGRLLVTFSDDNRGKLVEIGTGKVVRTFNHNNNGVYTFDFSPDSKIIAVAGNDQVARIIEIESGKVVKEKSHNNVIRVVEFDKSGDELYSESVDGVYKWTDINSNNDTEDNVQRNMQIYWESENKKYYISSADCHLFHIRLLINYFKDLSFEQLELLHKWAYEKEKNKDVVIIVNEKDKAVFKTMPSLLKLALKQNLKFNNLDDQDLKVAQEEAEVKIANEGNGAAAAAASI